MTMTRTTVRLNAADHQRSLQIRSDGRVS